MNSGDNAKAMNVGRRLAEAYVEMGQYSSALLEYEGILQMDPDNPEIMVALGDLSQRLHTMQVEEQARQGEEGDQLNDVFSDSGELIATKRTKKAEELKPQEAESSDVGNETFCKFLIQNRIVAEDIATKALDTIRGNRRKKSEQKITVPLLQEIVIRGTLDMEKILSGILNRLKFAYIPLDLYDVDRQVVKMLPDSYTFGNVMVPFDMISRTLMVAVSNPFDQVAMKELQQKMDYHIQWYLASPLTIIQVISDNYRIDKGPKKS